MASTDALIDEAYRAAVQLMADRQLGEDVAARYASADVVLREETGTGAPPITSGYRSLAKQRELYQRWSAGDPGVVVRPAERSWHTEGRAIDVSTRHPNFDRFVELWESWGGRWGGRFSKPDAVHFDVPGATPPRSAYT